MSTAAPVPAEERATLLDALRGFALFGVCLANLFTSFALLHAPGVPDLDSNGIDGVAAFFIHALVDGKFYSLFSLLFGIGFAIQMRRAEAAGDMELTRFKRRLRVLLGIGLVHLCLIWMGDILAFYAMVGFLLLLFRRMPDRKLLTWSAVMLLLPIAGYLPFWAAGGGRATIPVTPAIIMWLPGLGVAKAVGLDMMHGAGPDLLHGGWTGFGQALATGPFFRYAALIFEWRVFKVLSMFVLGLWIGRRRPWEDLESAKPLLKRAALGGLAIGLPANLAMALLDGGDAYYNGTIQGLWHAILYSLGVAPLAVGYAALFGLAWTTEAGRRIAGVLAPVGRMALTSYLTQSVVAILLFYDIGLGLGGTVGAAGLWLVAAIILAAQTAFATVWLRHYRFGPAEWVWRSLTYGQRQPMRLLPREPVLA